MHIGVFYRLGGERGKQINNLGLPHDTIVRQRERNVTVKPGKIPGTLLVEWDLVDHAHSYEARYARLPITEATVYTTVTTPKHSIVLEGLIQGQQYAIQIAGVNSDPHRAWSIEITSFVM